MLPCGCESREVTDAGGLVSLTAQTCPECLGWAKRKISQLEAQLELMPDSVPDKMTENLTQEDENG